MEKQVDALSPFGVKTMGPTIDMLPESARRFLIANGTRRVYVEGEIVQRHMALVQHASWIQSGRLRMLVHQADGSEHYIGWTMPGELFGVANTLLNSPSRMTMVVEKGQVQVLHFSRDLLVELMVTSPEVGIAINQGLCRRMMQIYNMIDVASVRLLSDKVRVLLSRWAEGYGIPARDGSVELWITQHELAAGVGASRQRVHVELQNLKNLGEIDLTYRKLVLHPLFFEKMGRFAPL